MYVYAYLFTLFIAFFTTTSTPYLLHYNSKNKYLHLFTFFYLIVERLSCLLPESAVYVCFFIINLGKDVCKLLIPRTCSLFYVFICLLY